MNFLILLITLSAVAAHEPFDFVEDSLKKYVNPSSDPCDNFYRHACPLDSTYDLMDEAFSSLTEEAMEKKDTDFWIHFKFLTVHSTLNFSTVQDSLSDFAKNISTGICLSDVDRLNLLVSKYFYNDITNKEPFNINNGPINCQEISESIEKRLVELWPLQSRTVTIAKELKKTIKYLLENLRAINAIIEYDVRDGISETKTMIKEMVEIAKEWIPKTPWTKNFNVTEQVTKQVSEILIKDNYAKDYKFITETFFKMDTFYNQCTRDFKDFTNGNVFCYISLYLSTKLYDLKVILRFFIYRNAFNNHPELSFGFPHYYHNQHANEQVSKLGVTGITVGHEIGHSLIDNNYIPEHFTYFSKIAQDCIQGQFNKTCAEYKEISCENGVTMLDDNGADIIGLQLAYELFLKYYGFRSTDKIERLGVTNEQLFFYAHAFKYCTGNQTKTGYYKNGGLGNHSTPNVRVNVIAQHPGFQKAFNCSSDSRMIRSATEQCFIYGKNAPQTRRKMMLDSF